MEEMFVLFPARIGGLALPDEVSYEVYKSYKNMLKSKDIHFAEVPEHLTQELPCKLGLIIYVDESSIIQLAINQSLVEYLKVQEVGSQVITTKFSLGFLHVTQTNDNHTQLDVSYFNKFNGYFTTPMSSKVILINSSFSNSTIRDSVSPDVSH